MSSNADSLRRRVSSSSAPPSAKSKTGRGKAARASSRIAATLWARRRQAGSGAIICPRSIAAEAIGADRGLAIELAFLVGARAFDHPVHHLDPLRIGAGKLQHMPVAAIHAALKAECLDRMRDVGLQLLSSPVLMIGFGPDPGDL